MVRKGAAMKKRARKHLTDEEIEHFRQRLLALKRDILATISEIEDEALREDRTGPTGPGAAEPGDLVDKGTQYYERDKALGLAESERKILQEIDRALAKIEEGSYGICEGTGKPIAKKRLEAVPYARYCTEYARQMEKQTPRGSGPVRRILY